MAQIISLSLNPELKASLDRLQKEYGFAGRSEAIRAGIRMLMQESRDISRLSGELNATLIVEHPEKHTSSVFDVVHRHQAHVKTQLHYHLDEDKCLEIFILHGRGPDLEKIVRDLKKESTHFAKLLVL